MKRGKQANEAQQDFQNWMRSIGCCVCGAQPELHHAIGSTGKHNQVPIGQWWVIPLCSYHHRGPNGVHSMAKGKRKPFEKRHWAELALGYDMGGHGVIPEKVINAIKDYHL